MHRTAAVWVFAPVCLQALVCSTVLAAGSTESIYGRTGTDGAYSLTNVPGDEGYQLLVPGTGASVSRKDPADPAIPAAAVEAAQRLPEPLLPQPIAADALASPPSAPQESLPSREQLQRAAAAAARTAAQTPDTTQTLASAMAGQALQDLSAAGSAGERLQALYQASLSAFAAKRPVPVQHH